jgi:cytochrome c-type biogenesis protein CcsB
MRGRDLVPAGAAADEASGGGVAVATKLSTATTLTTTVGGPQDGALPPGRRAGNIAMSVMWLGTILLGAGVLLRGLSVGRVPWGNMYEFSVTSAFAVALAYLLLSLRRDLRWLGIFVVVPVLLTLGLAVTVLYTDAAQLVPALKSYWLVIHVSAAVVCGGAFCVAATVTLLFLVADAGERRAAAGRHYRLDWLARRLPESTRLDALAYRIHAFMFPLWTFTVVAGAIWAENAWGRYWGWDPKETWAFITWVAYAAYLHARATAGWKGRKAAVIALVAFGCFLFNYFGINLLATGLHSYSGV